MRRTDTYGGRRSTDGCAWSTAGPCVHPTTRRLVVRTGLIDARVVRAVRNLVERNFYQCLSTMPDWQAGWRPFGRLFHRRLSTQAEYTAAVGRLLTNRRGIILFFGGFFLGGGGLSGAALVRWNQDATQPAEDEKEARRRRKAEAKLAAREDWSAACSGLVRRW
eukprot:6814688-Prymnesium_polylepis.1